MTDYRRIYKVVGVTQEESLGEQVDVFDVEHEHYGLRQIGQQVDGDALVELIVENHADPYAAYGALATSQGELQSLHGNIWNTYNPSGAEIPGIAGWEE